MTLIHANNNNNTIATNVTTVAPDQFRMDASTSIVDALNGNDTITLTNPYRNITIKGGNGNDSIKLDSSLVNSVVNGGNGNDTTTVAATGSATNTAFQSLEGNNSWIFNSASNFNSVTAGAGNDSIFFAAGVTSSDDVVLLGQGNDDADYNNGDVTRLNLGAGQGNDTITFPGAVTRSEIRGAKDNDLIIVNTLTDSTLRGGDGNDTLRVDGLVTNSLLIDTLGTANFVFGTATSQATVIGGDGSDTIAFTATGVTDVFFEYNRDIDLVSLETGNTVASIAIGAFAQIAGIRTLQNNSTAVAGTVITLDASGTTAGMKIIGNLQNDIGLGGLGADTIYGGSGDDVLKGNAGNDTIEAGEGDDRVFGNTGNDLLLGSSGADYIDAGQGTDSVYGGTGNDTINGGSTGVDLLFGEDGDDTFLMDDNFIQMFSSGALIDELNGGSGTNKLRLSFQNDQGPQGYSIAFTDNWSRATNLHILETGDANANAINIDLNTSAFTSGIHTVSLALDTNSAAANRIDASRAEGGQNLSLVGSVGTDVITGGGSNDTITGGASADRLTGGAGADVFRYTTAATSVGAAGVNADTITDFTIAVDDIGLQQGVGTLLAGVTLASTSTAAAFAANTVDATAVATTADVYTAIAANAQFDGAAFGGSTAAAGANQLVGKTISFANGAAAGTYLVVNDVTAGFLAANDLVIGLGTGLVTPAAGDIVTFA